MLVVRPVIKPLIGLGFAAGLGVVALGQFGLTVDDLRGGRLVSSLMSRVIEQAGGFDGIEGLEGLEEGSVAGMLDPADLGDPGRLQAMLQANGALLGEAVPVRAIDGEKKPKGVVIFSPDGPAAETVKDTEKPAPIVRVHRREAS